MRDAFSDFVRPSRFCRTLERVTPTQFDEALSHSIAGLTTVSVDDRALIAAAYTDPAGLIKYVNFNFNVIACVLEQRCITCIKPPFQLD